MLIKACLNGSRERDEHPGLPLMPEELAREARVAIEVGAGALHIHPRNRQGAQSLAPQVIGEALQAVRKSCPGIPVGVSTGLWIESTVERRLESVRAWRMLPDFASVNFSEPGAAELCALLQTRGVGIEAGISTLEDAESLQASGYASCCLRILLEPEEAEVYAALRTVESIVARLRAASAWRPLLLHGFEQTAWPLLDAALAHGYDTRIGFEDTLNLPDGSRATSNAQLVSAAVEKADLYHYS